MMIGMCAVAVLAVVTAQAATPEQGSGLMIRRVERRLGMTEAQREQVRAILVAERPAIQMLVARERAEDAALGKTDSFDEAYVRGFAQQHTATMTEVMVERERVRTELMQVLTAEQRTKLASLRAGMAAWIEERLAGLGTE